MANSYYTRNAEFTSATTARGSEVRSEFDLVVAGFNSLEAKIAQLEGDIANAQTGDPPGWGAAIDTRWYVTDTSSSNTTYTGILNTSPAGEYIQDGYSIEFDPNNNNTGASTLNVGSLDGAMSIVKVTDNVYAELDADDLNAKETAKLTAISGQWVLRYGRSTGVPIGTVLPYGSPASSPTIPDGFILAYGQQLSRVSYADLFAVWGTTYGTGDGSTTFNAIDMRGVPFLGYDNIGGTAADVLQEFKMGDLAGGDPNPPGYGNWLIKV